MSLNRTRVTASQNTEQRLKPIGLTITSPVLSTLQMVQSQLHASDTVKAGQDDASGMVKTRTYLQAGGTLTMSSGGDTTMQGATASGNKVTAAVGGNLNLSSLKDTSQYQDKSQSSGFSVSVPITGGAASASFSHSSTDINSNYQSVGEQTALRAGDGGFDIDVQGKTTLTGAQITSTQAAIDNNKNKFKSAGGLDMQDLQNSAQFDASSYSVSATVRGDNRNEDGTPRLDAAGKPVKGKPEGSAGFGSDSGQGSSTSTAGISGIAGNTTARTGDEETGLKPLFDAAKTKAEVQSQVAITAEFGKNASKAWGDYATNKEKELRDLGQHEEADKWREGGVYRAAGHFAIGGLGGGGAGALASGGISLAADKLNSLQDELKDKLIELGMSPDAAQMFSQGAGMATAGTLGTAAGGTVGGGSAFNTDTSNRQLHFEEKESIRIAAGGDKEKQERLTKAACFEVKCWAQYPEGSELYKANYVSVAEMSGLQAEWDWVKGQKDFGAFNYTPSQKFTDWVASKTGLASGTFGGKPISSGGSNTQNCATAECVAGLMPAPSEMRSVEQIDKDLKTKICSWSVGGAVNALVPGSLVMKPVVNAAGEVVGWFSEKAFDQMTSDGASYLVCQY